MSPHNHMLHSHQRARRYDPTRTTMLRQKFEADMVRRFTELKKKITRAIVTDDGFGLEPTGIIRVQRTTFGFGNDARKVDAFLEWLRQQQQAGILEVQRGASVRSSGSRAWTDIYIESAYQKGIAQAGANLRGMGVEVSDRWIDAGFNRPIHADRAGLIFSRTFNELQGVTDAMDQQISRVLAQGIIDGLNPRALARQITDRVDAIGITRARMIARTEIISAHHQATINSYREAGVEGVEIEAEFSTAADDLVCAECEGFDGKMYSLDDAEKLIPVHPNCRCTTIAKVLSVDGVKLE